MSSTKNDIFRDFIGILLAALILLGVYVLFMVSFPGTKSDSSSSNYETSGATETRTGENKANVNNNEPAKRSLAPLEKTPSFGFAPSGWDNKQNYPPERAKHNTPQK